MSLPRYSPTYVALLDILFKTNAISHKMKRTFMEGMTFRTESTEVEKLITTEDFYMNASELWAQCTPHEWYMIGRIGSELKYQCALWSCTDIVKTNSANRRAIRSLIEKNVLIKTETTNVYLVNPKYIRRGDTISVIYSTAKMLQDVKKVLPGHITSYKTVKEYTPLLSEGEIEMFSKNLVN